MVLRVLYFTVLCLSISTSSVAQNTKDLLRKVNQSQDTVHAYWLSKLIESIADSSKGAYADSLRDFTEHKLKITAKKQPDYSVYEKYHAISLSQIGLNAMNNLGKFEKAIPYFEKANALYKKSNNQVALAAGFSNLGYAYHGAENFKKSLASFEESLSIRQRIGDEKLISLSYYQIGVYYARQQDIPNGMKYHFKALKIREKLHDVEGLAHSYNDIGTLFYFQQDNDQALKFYKKVLPFENKFTDQMVIAGTLGNIALIYNSQGKVDKALEFNLRSLELSKRKGYKKIISSAANNIGRLYQGQGKLAEALEYYKQSLEIDVALNNRSDMAISYVNISNVYFELKNYSEALKYADKSLELATKSNFPKTIEDAEWMHYVIYKAKGDSKEALGHYENFVAQRDDIRNGENQKAISDMKYRYEYEKKAAADSLQSAGEKQVFAAELKQEKTQKYALYGGLALVAFFGLFMFNRFKITQKQKRIIEKQEQETKRQNELISLQKEEVEFQKVMLEEKQREIVDSITYAKRLQEAILPPLSFIQSVLPKSFVYYQPKDIVAGDFYWVEQAGDYLYIAAADSTGHGVPGAMVSVVCSNALNRSVNEFGLRKTGEILDRTRELVVETLAKNDSSVKDGMDISLLSFNQKTQKVFWSGANNPLWFIDHGVLSEVKPDKQPIGRTDNAFPFTTHEISCSLGTMFYLFTDGFADQFGGDRGKKFKYGNFKELLSNISEKSPEEQALIIQSTFHQWKGELEQVDDVCVLGIQID